MIDFMNLEFKQSELEPVISKKTVEFHYGKHHKAYVDKTNELIMGTDFQNMSLEEIIEATYGDVENVVLYNNAGQVYNHNMYWKSFGIGKRLNADLREKIIKEFGSMEELKRKLVEKGMSVFGSGWVWLTEDENHKLEVMITKNGDTPLVENKTPIFNIDVWEHAYYLDYQNLRKTYLEEVINNLFYL